MKKLLSLCILMCVLLSSVPVLGYNSFIKLEPYPYSNLVLGEDLIVWGDTDFEHVSISLMYPDNIGTKFNLIIDAAELRNGYVLHTKSGARDWPSGVWTIKVNNGSIYDEFQVSMTKTPVYDQTIRLAKYEDMTLTSVTSYTTRGMQIENNVLSFPIDNSSEVKIFSWNNFAPAAYGESRIFFALYNDGYLTDIQTYSGTLSSYGKHIDLKIDDNRFVKLFYWNENLIPKE